MKYLGGCHCGAIRFEVNAPCDLKVINCNCSICKMTGYWHLIVLQDQFKLLTGADKMVTYTFNSGIAKHTFCKICGIKPFYTPRSNTDAVDVNVRCLSTKPVTIEFKAFDGLNWEKHADELSYMIEKG